MKKNSILKIFLVVILLLVLVSILKTSGYISSSIYLPKDWRTNPEFLKPYGDFTDYDRSIFIKLTDNQMKAIYTIVMEKFNQNIITKENITLLSHNLAQSGKLKEIANKLIVAKDREKALKVFDDYNKKYKLI